MSLTRAIADTKRFTQGEFSKEITFENPGATESATVSGLVSKHNLSIDPATGMPVNSRNIHISVAETVLTDEGYTVRDVNNEVSLRKHKVTWEDANGTSIQYIINEVMPSDTVGLIVCTLGDYE